MPKYIEREARPIEYPDCIVSDEAKTNYDAAYIELQLAYLQLKSALDEYKRIRG